MRVAFEFEKFNGVHILEFEPAELKKVAALLTILTNKKPARPPCRYFRLLRWQSVKNLFRSLGVNKKRCR